MMLVGLLFSLQVCGSEEKLDEDTERCISNIAQAIIGIRYMDAALTEKDKIITDLETRVSTTERANCILSATLAKRDEQIKGLSATLAERDGQIKGLSEKVRELTTLNSQLTKDSQNRSVASLIYWK